jgi:hypothetical protein
MVSAAQFCDAINEALGEMMTDTTERDNLIRQWRDKSRQLATLKDEESVLRTQIVATYYDAEKQKGTEYIELGDGYRLKCEKKMNAKLKTDLLNDALDKCERIGERAKFYVERLFKWKPELSVTEWKDVSERAEGGDVDAQKIMEILIGGDQTLVTFEPGLPALSFIEPKPKA